MLRLSASTPIYFKTVIVRSLTGAIPRNPATLITVVVAKHIQMLVLKHEDVLSAHVSALSQRHK